MVAGTPLTLRIGFIAGFLGVGIGTVLAFVAGYYRGMTDTVIRGIADIGLTVPGLLVLIIIAVSMRGGLTVNQMAIVVASLAWLNPTRTIRAQVLTLRERGYVEVARLYGMSGPEIILREMMPNLLPYLAATLVNAVSAAILASIGLEVLGLGPLDSPTLGMTLYWVNFNAAHHQRLVVVVGRADRHHPHGVPRPVLPHGRARRDRQSPPAAIGMNAARAARREIARRYDHPRGVVRAVDDVSFSLRPGERLGLVGESGSGKSTMALAILRLIQPPGHIEGGEVWLDDLPLSSLSDDAMRELRLAGIALVPQGSMNSLNPVLRIREQIADALADHGTDLSQRDCRPPACAICSAMSACRRTWREMYPHELTGGMKQRVCIAIAICLQPKVIIADEPTSALDVVVQRQVMATLAPRAAGTRRRGDPGRPRHGPDGAVRRPARRDVRRPPGRDRADRGDLHGADASLHADADRQPAVAGAQGDDAGHSRAGAAAARPAARLRVPSALPAGRGALPRRAAGTARGGSEHAGGVPSCRSMRTRRRSRMPACHCAG